MHPLSTARMRARPSLLGTLLAIAGAGLLLLVLADEGSAHSQAPGGEATGYVGHDTLSFPPPVAIAHEEGRLRQAPGSETPCPAWHLGGVGTVCIHIDGRIEAYAPGLFLGEIEMPHPVATTGGMQTAFTGTRDLYCVAPWEAFWTEIIYAVPMGNSTQWPQNEPVIVEALERMNWVVNEAAQINAHTADIRVKCVDDRPLVHHVRLSTNGTSLVDVAGDLYSQGFRNRNTHYLVVVEGLNPSCGCTGLATRYSDDRLEENNHNNGYRISYALHYVDPSRQTLPHHAPYMAATMLHEWSHMSGAVQDSAPHSSKRGHCIDGLDIMCTYDGSPLFQNYTKNCQDWEYDCEKDDYFNTAPYGYLSNHWNLGDCLHNFLFLPHCICIPYKEKEIPGFYGGPVCCLSDFLDSGNLVPTVGAVTSAAACLPDQPVCTGGVYTSPPFVDPGHMDPSRCAPMPDPCFVETSPLRVDADFDKCMPRPCRILGFPQGCTVPPSCGTNLVACQDQVCWRLALGPDCLQQAACQALGGSCPVPPCEDVQAPTVVPGLGAGTKGASDWCDGNGDVTDVCVRVVAPGTRFVCPTPHTPVLCLAPAPPPSCLQQLTPMALGDPPQAQDCIDPAAAASCLDRLLPLALGGPPAGNECLDATTGNPCVQKLRRMGLADRPHLP